MYIIGEVERIMEKVAFLWISVYVPSTALAVCY